MPFSDDSNNIPKTSAAKDPISTHRAWVYGACAPGYGEIYAGARLRGYATLTLFVLFSAWFTWNLYVILRSIVGQIFDSLNGMTPVVLPNLPVASLAASFSVYIFSGCGACCRLSMLQ